MSAHRQGHLERSLSTSAKTSLIDTQHEVAPGTSRQAGISQGYDAVGQAQQNAGADAERCRPLVGSRPRRHPSV